MAKINKKYLFIVILLVCLFLFTTGYSTWIILNVKDLDESTLYNYREIVTKAYDGQTKEYTGQPLKPDAIYNGEIDLFDSSTYEFFEYKLTDGSNDWKPGKPEEVGEYYLHIRNSNDKDSEPMQVTFTISQSDKLRGYSFTEDIKSIGIGGTFIPTLTPENLPDGLSIQYFIQDGDNETPFELLSTDEVKKHNIIAKFVNSSNPNYTDTGYIVDDSSNIIKMQLNVVDKILINYYDYDNNIIYSEYVDYDGKAVPPYPAPAANYMYTYFWSYKDDSADIVDFENLKITEEINFQLKRSYKKYNVSVFYVDRDNVATTAEYDFATNVTSTYINTTFEFGSTIDNLYKEMKIVLSTNYYYLSSIDQFQLSDWEKLENVTNGGYKEYKNYTLAVNGNNLTIIIHCVQAQAIVHTGALTETATTIGDPLGTYYANAHDAFIACSDTLETKYLRIFGIAKSKNAKENCYMPDETPSVVSYSSTINGYSIKFASYNIDLSGYTIDFNYHISSKLHVILSYGREDISTTGYLTKQTANSAGSGNAIHSVLCIAEGTKITVDGSFIVGGVVKSAGEIASHAVVMNNGEITFNNSSQLISYGYVRGIGKITLKNGASIHDVYKIYDWKGGANSMGVSGAGVRKDADYFPFNCYSSHNTSCDVTIEYGAKYYALNQLYMADAWACYDDLLLVGTGGLFELTDTTGYLIRSIEETTLTTNINKSYTALSEADDSNDAKQITIRDVYSIYGGFKDNSISVTIKVLMEKTITSSKQLALPLGLIKLNILSGNGLLTSNSFRCLPGSYIYIGSDATLTIDSGVNVVMYENYLDDYQYTDPAGVVKSPHEYSYSVKHSQWFESGRDDIGAQLIIDGTLICEGNIGGIIKSNENGKFSTKGNTATAIEIVTLKYASTGGNKTQITKTYQAIGVIGFVEAQKFENNVNYYYYDGSWHKNTGTITFNSNYDSNDILGSKVVTILSNGNIGYQISESDLKYIDPTRLHYSFGGWYLDSECSDNMKANDKKIYYSTILYAKWTPVNYDITYNIDNFDNCESDGLQYDTSLFVNSYNCESNILLPIDLQRPGYKFDGWYTDPEFTNKITHINSSTINSIGDITIYGLWTDPNSRMITFKYNSNSPVVGIFDSEELVVSSRVTSYILLNYNDNELVINSDKYFEGWYVDATCLTKFDVSIHINDSTTEINLYAKWLNKYTVKLSSNGEIIESFNALEESKIPKPDDPTLEGYNFKGWYTDVNYTTVWNFDSDLVSSNVTLYAKYERISFTITYNKNGGEGSMDTDTVEYGENYKIKDNLFSRSNYTFVGWNTKSDGTGTSYEDGATINNLKNNITLYAQWNKNQSSGGTCLAEGTLITMADGTKKKVEDLVYGDKVLVFNHDTGKLEVSTLIFNAHKDELISMQNVVNLHFSNGVVLRIVAHHGIFDLTLNEYVEISKDNVNDFIGHEFTYVSYVNGQYVCESVVLTDYQITEEYIKVYSPITANQINCFAEGFLTAPGLYNRLMNIFEYDYNMTVDVAKKQEDIEKYGLYDYSVFEEYVSYEIYQAFNGQYFRVAVEKGIITLDEIIQIILDFNIKDSTGIK